MVEDVSFNSRELNLMITILSAMESGTFETLNDQAKELVVKCRGIEPDTFFMVVP